MDKIKALMEQMGFSPELSNELLKAINEYTASKDKAVNEEFEGKLKKAKEVCLQAVKEEKARLARGLEVFLENKTEKIERARAQQMANEETESSNQLKRVKAMLEGVELSKVDDKDGQLQAANRKISLLEHKVERIAVDKRDVEGKLRISNDIAAKHMRRAMMLESRAKKTQVLDESKRKDNVKGEGVVKQSSLNEIKETRAPLTEAKKPSTTNKEITIDNIAETM
jgi:hypothetical protein